MAITPIRVAGTPGRQHLATALAGAETSAGMISALRQLADDLDRAHKDRTEALALVAAKQAEAASLTSTIEAQSEEIDRLRAECAAISQQMQEMRNQGAEIAALRTECAGIGLQSAEIERMRAECASMSRQIQELKTAAPVERESEDGGEGGWVIDVAYDGANLARQLTVRAA